LYPEGFAGNQYESRWQAGLGLLDPGDIGDRYDPLKRRFYGLCGVISQKTEFFKTTAVRTSNPIYTSIYIYIYIYIYIWWLFVISHGAFVVQMPG
jgi:hypothetical protein